MNAAWVDVVPARIPDPLALDLVEQFLNQQPTNQLRDDRVRIPCDSHAVAANTAALLRSYGAPATAIRIGRTNS